MEFVRLRVSGFKSFCDATELEIGPGLTGIVGPNGCGKSNVVEALRWVMGESSAKGLRGGEMDDVIFGGSAMRAAFDLADVSLGLKRPPVADPGAAVHVLPHSEDLEISRRIGRGTGSLYRLNGREVRARDIQLLFADAGAGAKSPAIVGQGQVGFIVEAKPEERRRLLEEAAGIGGMHSRRREAELKLQATLNNLERVTDQLVILADRRAALEKQAKEAERYKKLQAQIRALDAYLVRARITAGRAALEAAGTALGEARLTQGERRSLALAAEAAHEAAGARLPALRDAAAVAAALLARLTERHDRQAEATAQKQTALERLIADRDETAARLDGLARAIEAGSARQATIVSSKAELEATYAALVHESQAIGPAVVTAGESRARLDDARREAITTEAEIERRLEADRTRHDERHRRLRAVQLELERLGEVADDALVEAAVRKHEAAEATVAAAAALVETTRAERNAAAEPLDSQRSALASATSRAQEETKRLAGLEAEADRQRTAITAQHERRDWHSRARQQLASEAERLEAERKGLAEAESAAPVTSETDLQAMRDRLAALDEAIAGDEQQLAAAGEQHDGLSARLGEVASERVRLEAEAAALASLAEPVEASPVLDGIVVEPGHETALVAALGDDLMAGTDNAAAAFWTESLALTAGARPELPADATPLDRFVTGAPALARRLAQVGMVADATAAARLQSTLAQGQRLVTRDGGLWRWDGFVRGIEADDPIRAKLARRQRAQAIAGQLDELATTERDLASELEVAKDVLASAAAEAEALRTEQATLGPQIERAALALEAAREQAARCQAEAERLATVLARVASERAEHETALAAIELTLADAATADLDAALDAARAAVAAADTEAASHRTALDQGEAALQAADAALASAEAAERQAAQEALAARLLYERRAGEASLRKAHRQDATTGLAAEAAQLRQELEALDETIEAGAAALGDARARREALEAETAEASAELDRLRGRQLAIDAEQSSAEARLRALDEETAHLAADLERRETERLAAAGRLEVLDAERAEQSARLATSGSDALQAELTAAEAASSEAAAALQAAEAELARLESERRLGEAALAEAREAMALAEAEVERQAEAQQELERETARRLGQSITAILDAVADTEIGEALRSEPPAALEVRLDKLKASRERLGAVNLRAALECEELATEIADLESDAAELQEAVERLQRAIGTLNREARTRLEAVFEDVDRHFRQLFQRLFGGGKAHLRLTNMDDPLNAGLELEAMPPGKKLQNIRLLSGGEKSLTALALVFAFFLTQPSPLCVLDEVDAALDDANVERFADLLEEMAKETKTRFLVVTHHPLTMARMHRLFGVTMAERGVSKLVSVAFDEAERFKESA